MKEGRTSHSYGSYRRQSLTYEGRHGLTYMGEKSVGETYMGEMFVGERLVGEKSVGEKSVGEKSMGVDGMLAFVPPFSGFICLMGFQECASAAKAWTFTYSESESESSRVKLVFFFLLAGFLYNQPKSGLNGI